MPSPQKRTQEDIFATLGTSGFAGIAAVAAGAALTVTITPGAWAVLLDGTVVDDQLVTTTLPNNTVNGTYTLWLDYTWGDADVAPVWSLATVAPSANALALGTVTVAANVISAVVMNPPGLGNYPLAGAFATAAPAAGAGAALPATPAGYVTLMINGVARKVAVY
jgi:hypothetical protein